MKNIERKTGIGLIVVAVFSLGEAFRLIKLHPMRHYVGPATFPFMVGLGILVLGLYFVFTNKSVSDVKGTRLPVGETARKMLYTMVVMIGYTATLPLLGYPISTLVASILLFKIIGNYSFKVNILSGLLVTAVLYIVFSKLVYIPFPKGFIWWLS